jgi:hypothetical protein
LSNVHISGAELGLAEADSESATAAAAAATDTSTDAHRPPSLVSRVDLSMLLVFAVCRGVGIPEFRYLLDLGDPW